MRRRRALTVLACSALADLASRGTGLAQSASPAIRVAGVPTEGATNMFYGVKSGLFARAGLSVEQITIGSGTAATTAVIAGTYELAYTSLMAVINAHLRGIGIVVVLPANLHVARDPLALLQTSADAKFRTGSDLNGKTAGVPALDDLNTISVSRLGRQERRRLAKPQVHRGPKLRTRTGDPRASRGRRSCAVTAVVRFARGRYDPNIGRLLERHCAAISGGSVRCQSGLGGPEQGFGPTARCRLHRSHDLHRRTRHGDGAICRRLN